MLCKYISRLREYILCVGNPQGETRGLLAEAESYMSAIQ